MIPIDSLHLSLEKVETYTNLLQFGLYRNQKCAVASFFFLSFFFAGALKTSTYVKNLGIMMVDNLSFANHILALATSS